MRAFFSTYTKASKRADDLRFQAGNAAAIDEACQRSPVSEPMPPRLCKPSVSQRRAVILEASERITAKAVHRDLIQIGFQSPENPNESGVT